MLQSADAQTALQELSCLESLPGQKPSPGSTRVCFRYRDFSGAPHRFNCHVDSSFVHGEEAAFGYLSSRETLLRELDLRLAEEIVKKAGPLAKYARIEISHRQIVQEGNRGPIQWEFSLAERRWEEERPAKARLPAHLRKDVVELERWIAENLRALGHRIYHDYFQERGFDYDPLASGDSGRLDIAYKRLADRARPALSDCFDKFVREAAPADDEELVQLLLAAFQDIGFQFPLIEDGSLYKAGFWVPTQVLRLGRGDCDSKATALCALWQPPGPQIVLFVKDVPEDEKLRLPPEMRADQHAVLGIEAYPGFKQTTVEWGLRHYTLCEVVRPEDFKSQKLRPGEELFAGPPLVGFCMTDDCNGDSRKEIDR